MLDDAPITGGCHFPWDCLGYTAQCGSCPGIYSNDRYDITYKQLQQKKELFEKIDISAIATSEGDYLRAKSSSLFKENQSLKCSYQWTQIDLYQMAITTITEAVGYTYE